MDSSVCDPAPSVCECSPCSLFSAAAASSAAFRASVGQRSCDQVLVTEAADNVLSSATDNRAHLYMARGTDTD